MNEHERTPMLIPYYDSLERLANNQSVIVPRGTKITLKSVALEAGKCESSIKNNRPVFSNLIESIKLLAKNQLAREKPKTTNLSAANQRYRKSKVRADDYKTLYEAALIRELMLLAQIDELERTLKRSGNIIPFPPP